MGAGLVAAFRALPWTVAGLAYVRTRRRPGEGPRIGVAVLVAAVLVGVFGALFASADPAFAELVSGWSPHVEAADTVRALLRAGLAVLTLVIVAAALRRMALYEQAYGWTRLRVLVGAVELWLGLLFVLVLVAGVRLRAGWLPRAVAGTAAAGLLAVAI